MKKLLVLLAVVLGLLVSGCVTLSRQEVISRIDMSGVTNADKFEKDLNECMACGRQWARMEGHAPTTYGITLECLKDRGYKVNYK